MIHQLLSDSLRIAIVTPVFNDWSSCSRLISELDAVGSELDDVILDVLIVEDGSSNMNFVNLVIHGLNAKSTDHVGELRAGKWDFYRAFPSTVFPVNVADLPGDALTPVPTSPVVIIDKSIKTPGGTWTLKGSLQGDLPPGVKHLFFARGDEIIGYGVPALYPAFENKARQPWAGWGELPARLSAAVSRLVQLLRREQYWNGVSKSNPEMGEWQCEWRLEATLLCRASATLKST